LVSLANYCRVLPSRSICVYSAFNFSLLSPSTDGGARYIRQAGCCLPSLTHRSANVVHLRIISIRVTSQLKRRDVKHLGCIQREMQGPITDARSWWYTVQQPYNLVKHLLQQTRLVLSDRTYRIRATARTTPPMPNLDSSLNNKIT